MPWTQVDFRCVRYSPIEGTHYFYDSAYPTTIQFLLSGRWEPWDVGWVKYKAKDPDIRRVADEAETRLAQDANSGYTPWPTPPPPGPPPALNYNYAYVQPQSNRGQPGSNHTQPSASVSPSSEHNATPTISIGPNVSYTSPCVPIDQTDPDPNSVGSDSRILPTKSVASSQINGHPSLSNHPSPSEVPLQPVPPVLAWKRETKILLSIDGDGVRGLSTLLVIESLVNAICVKLGQRLEPHQIFDLTGGSSLGGVIAILLCRLRMEAHRAREAYKKIANQVFANKRDFFLSLDPHASPSNADGVALGQIITTVVKQELGNEDELLFNGCEETGNVFVVASHIEIGANKPALIRSYQTRRITGSNLDTNMPIVQAMIATCTAPRYMAPPHTPITDTGINPAPTRRLVLEPGLVDYGTAKNNPVRDLLYEYRNLFRDTNETMVIISVGTGELPTSDRETTAAADMAGAVANRCAEARSWHDKFEHENAALMDVGWMRYFRFNVEGGSGDVPLDECKCEDRVKQVTSAYLARHDVRKRCVACVDAVVGVLLGR